MPDEMNPSATPSSAAPESESPPWTVRGAGALVALEGAVSIVIAVVLIVRAVSGSGGDEGIGWATAAWFVLLGAAVLAAGVALVIGKKGGRAIAIVVQLLLAPVVWTLFTSGQPAIGAALGAVVGATLLLLMAAPSSRWLVGD